MATKAKPETMNGKVGLTWGTIAKILLPIFSAGAMAFAAMYVELKVFRTEYNNHIDFVDKHEGKQDTAINNNSEKSQKNAERIAELGG